MNKVSRISNEPRSKVLWLRITLSDKLDALGVDTRRQRFQAWVRRHELFAAIAPERLAVLASGRLMSAEDRGVVIGWRVAQPEVLVIRVERAQARSAVAVQAQPEPEEVIAGQTCASEHVSSDARLGFTLWLETAPERPSAQEIELQRCLKNFARDHGLVLHGGLFCSVVRGAERSLGLCDQVALIHWLVSQPLVCTVMVSPLSPKPDAARPGDGAPTVHNPNVLTMALKILYQMQRITPQQYVQILGGYVRPVQAARGRV
jgi:hypothetical protein